ncbi:Rpn family recombination-promoting nuclease/putative transposase [Cohnella herbarum]|uniref:Transposase n=1 Tax=Cohnella herbarum TaxID=2728023 RepID=A0A7Z2ZPI6_9BACL|nr:Rpn family recombination-promoting nuclease/putative transposase [Cohnella herbarum]QJD86915.1 transposase [Cohnella herbarum]
MGNSERPSKAGQEVTPHDEAFKKLLQTFFAEFIELFFPKVHELLDYGHTRFLMQEQLVDIVGEQTRTLDLLIETKYKGSDAYVLIHLEPQSYKDARFRERMFIYFSRLYERHRNEHKLIIPIAVFSMDNARSEPDTLTMEILEHQIVRFQFLKVELGSQSWRKFIDSDNPVAAALLAKMSYNEGEQREIRIAYLRMLLRLRGKLDEARLALMMSVADLYNRIDLSEDAALLRELGERYPEVREDVEKLMPAWSREGYEKGIKEGMEQGLEQGKEQGIEAVVLNMLRMGADMELIRNASGWPEEKIERLRKRNEA